MYRLLRISLGCLLVLLGVIGLFVPVLQGFLFLGIGGLLLCRDVPFLQQLIRRLKIRYPLLECATERVKETLPPRR